MRDMTDHQDIADRPDHGSAPERRGPGMGILVLLAPVACCGGPLLIAALAAAGALAWAGLGLAAAVVLAVAVALVIRRRRRRACR